MAGNPGNEPCMQKAAGEDGSEFFSSHCGEGAGNNRAEPSAEETARAHRDLGAPWGPRHPSQRRRGKGCLGWEPLAVPSAQEPLSQGSPKRDVSETRPEESWAAAPARLWAPGGAALHRKDSWWHGQDLPSQPQFPAVARLGVKFTLSGALLGKENGRFAISVVL